MYGVEHMLYHLHQERANCCWEDGAVNGLRTKHLLDLHACTAAGGSSCSFPLAALHSRGDAHAQAQRGRAAPWGPESRQEKRSWSRKNTFSGPTAVPKHCR